ncbi:hypothetical protein D0U04_17890 [Bacillus clarus]|uniref:Uncharacterized protein n=1 Tax=Bacillus clarus TaxID=2338372 RepID=A0A090YZZ9_9BACI|nr:hypothetical protein [Bacillus clarus]KFN03957.1 hypothetical protein DJ93_4586 [Bacillus clarus]RFT65631.1 hypothetical protein D0U04_17890 [Bacillus clarus]
MYIRDLYCIHTESNNNYAIHLFDRNQTEYIFTLNLIEEEANHIQIIIMEDEDSSFNKEGLVCNLLHHTSVSLTKWIDTETY